jgi:hypothetical protein
MLQIQGTNITSVESLEEDGYTNILNEEIREERDNCHMKSLTVSIGPAM